MCCAWGVVLLQRYYRDHLRHFLISLWNGKPICCSGSSAADDFQPQMMQPSFELLRPCSNRSTRNIHLTCIDLSLTRETERAPALPYPHAFLCKGFCFADFKEKNIKFCLQKVRSLFCFSTAWGKKQTCLFSLSVATLRMHANFWTLKSTDMG